MLFHTISDQVLVLTTACFSKNINDSIQILLLLSSHFFGSFWQDGLIPKIHELLLMAEIRRSPPGMVLKPCKLPGISYQPQLVIAGFQPSTVWSPKTPSVCDILLPRRCKLLWDGRLRSCPECGATLAEEVLKVGEVSQGGYFSGWKKQCLNGECNLFCSWEKMFTLGFWAVMSWLCFFLGHWKRVNLNFSTFLIICHIIIFVYCIL